MTTTTEKASGTHMEMLPAALLQKHFAFSQIQAESVPRQARPA